MSLQVVQLEEKHTVEKVEYEFDLSRISAFANGLDTLDTQAAWYIYDTADTTTNLSGTMVYAYDYSAADNIIKCTVQGGTAGKSYYLVGVATITVSGRKYLVMGEFDVVDLGISI